MPPPPPAFGSAGSAQFEAGLKEVKQSANNRTADHADRPVSGRWHWDFNAHRPLERDRVRPDSKLFA